jgi:hypothetical protein
MWKENARQLATGKGRLMLAILMWLTARPVKRFRLPFGRPASRLVATRMQRRHLRDIGLAFINQQSLHLHFASAEAQLGMIR